MYLYCVYKLLSILFILASLSTYSQEDVNEGIPIDDRYREDQFYINITYNIVSDMPNGAELRGLTGGLGFGFVRDLPINKRRNVAVGIGAGLSFNQYGQNLFIGEDEEENTLFRVLDDNADFDINRFSTATVEVPLEFRWRTSTAQKYKFWRVYTGVRVGYTFWYRSYFSQENNSVSQTDISEFQTFSITPTFSFGFNKINFFASYAVTPFFKDSQTNLGEEVGFNPIRLGLIFYIL